jgi:hypothetical protein
VRIFQLVTTTAYRRSGQGRNCRQGRVPLRNLSIPPTTTSSRLVMADAANPWYVYVTDNHLQAFDAKGLKKLDVLFDQPVHVHIPMFISSPQTMSSSVILEQNSGRIHLIGLDGKNYKGFPLKGNSRFSIGFLTSSAFRFNLIVGGEHNFLNNYHIE